MLSVNKKRKVGGMLISMVNNRIVLVFVKLQYIIIDKWIARQMEIHPSKKPVLLVAGFSFEFIWK